MHENTVIFVLGCDWDRVNRVIRSSRPETTCGLVHDLSTTHLLDFQMGMLMLIDLPLRAGV